MKRLLFFVYLCTVTMHSFSAQAPNKVKCSCEREYARSGLAKHQNRYKKGYQHSCPTCGMRAMEKSGIHPNGDHATLKSAFNEDVREQITFFCFYCIRDSIKKYDRKPLFATTNDLLIFNTSEEREVHIDNNHFKVGSNGAIMPKGASESDWINKHEEVVDAAAGVDLSQYQDVLANALVLDDSKD